MRQASTLLETVEGIRAGHDWDDFDEAVAFVESKYPGGTWRRAFPSQKGDLAKHFDYDHPQLKFCRLLNRGREREIH